LSEQITRVRWVVVNLSADAHGDGAGKGADATLYPCESREEAEQLADRLDEHHMDIVYSAGGYPDKAWVMDLANPEEYGDTEGLIADLDEWDDEFGEEEAAE
jgi:hypothetical protein